MACERLAGGAFPERLNRLPTLKDLIVTLESGETELIPNHFLSVLVPIGDINILTQPRKTFENIEALGGNIGEVGQINPITLALLDEKQCQAYLQTLNTIWKTNHQITDLVPISIDGGFYFCVLLAGERRLRSYHYLKDSGCENCHTKYGPGPCFERHFPPSLFPHHSVEGRLRPQLSPEEALDLQFSENTHMRVPPHEEARAYYNYLIHKRRPDPGYPLSLFARRVGRTPETIRQAVKFCELPIEIQEYVEKGFISYGIACEIARLQESAKIDEEDLKWWVTRAIANNHKVPEFRQLVTDYLFNLNSGQTMLGLFTEEQKREAKRTAFRRVVAREMVQANWHFLQYFSRVLRLFQEGKLGKPESPFSEGSPLRTLRALLSLQRELLVPHLQDLLPKKDQQQAQETLTELNKLLALTEASGVVVAENTLPLLA